MIDLSFFDLLARRRRFNFIHALQDTLPAVRRRLSVKAPPRPLRSIPFPYPRSGTGGALPKCMYNMLATTHVRLACPRHYHINTPITILRRDNQLGFSAPFHSRLPQHVSLQFGPQEYQKHPAHLRTDWLQIRDHSTLQAEPRRSPPFHRSRALTRTSAGASHSVMMR